ncbi:hypothetical protein [Tessaracoccus sp. OH4464_COT-324]|uniref:hypothetical protein n=1 Tax=Tessaracoccus sp. OH4464_COT-324 TaxID=2491059 RepID=UPI000F630D0C|nr:hypothetical protein [Tessaracoccus sp. OH4464_COT-324]RRD47252.1 hypothetical protein EII42_03045 [Tessaracoccus sp. OH4464_COT-324]
MQFTDRDWLLSIYSVLDTRVAKHFALDPDELLRVSGADRIGDLNPRNVGHSDILGELTADNLDIHCPMGLALGQQLVSALERRQWLWLAVVDERRVSALQELLGPELLHIVGPATDQIPEAMHPKLENAQRVVPVAINPCQWVQKWATEGDEHQRSYLHDALEGTDTLTVSRHVYAALQELRVDVIDRAPVLRFIRSPKVIAYIVVLLYSALRALPVSFVPEFHGRLWILWAIDLGTAIPYTWGIVAAVAARSWKTRALGAVVAVITFVLPYVYFWANGKHYPPYVVAIVVGMIVGAIALEIGRILRDKLVARRVAG